MSENTIDQNELGKLVTEAVLQMLREKQSSIVNHQSSILIGVCCGDCLNDGAKKSLQELRGANFHLHQPADADLKKREAREKLIAQSDGVLLPALGDDDIAKLSTGIFDEPVTRLALSALAEGKPVWAAVHSPYERAIKRNAPALHRKWEEQRRAVESFGIEIVEYSVLASRITEVLSPNEPQSDKTNSNQSGKRVLITAQQVEETAQNGKRLEVPNGAIVTPLARDRAKELNVKLN